MARELENLLSAGYNRLLSNLQGRPMPGSSDEKFQKWVLSEIDKSGKGGEGLTPGQQLDLLKRGGLATIDLDRIRTTDRLKTAQAEMDLRGQRVGQDTGAVTTVIGARSSADAARAAERLAMLDRITGHESAMAGESDAARAERFINFATSENDKNRALANKGVDQQNVMNMLGLIAQTASLFV